MKNTKQNALVAVAICCVLGIAGLATTILNSGSNQNMMADTSRMEIEATFDNNDNVYVVPSSAALAIDISDPDIVAEYNANIALVRIDSVDGSNNYSEVYNEYVFPYTYGHMTVLENIKGDVPTGESIKFYKLGGTLSIDQYYAGLTEGEKEKFDLLTNNGESLDTTKQIKRVMAGDVDVEAGKTYLVYMNSEISYYAEPNTYAITCYQGGLREVRLQENRGARSYSDVKVLNNFTGEWENLSDITFSVR